MSEDRGGRRKGADLSKLSDEDKLKRAKMRVLMLLQRRPYTEYQLRSKLSDSGYEDKIISDTIEYIRGLNLIDDYKYARDYIAYSSSRKSRKRIMFDLYQKGVPKDIVNSALESVITDGDLADEEQLIRKLMDKRHFDPATATYEQTQKMRAYLYGKGFDSDTISHCL